MRIVVISLADQGERRSFMSRQLQKLGLDFEYYDAINLRSCSEHWLETLDLWSFRMNSGRCPVMSEIGCYASHYNVWLQVVKSGEPVIVLEDDAQLSPRFVAALKLVEAHIDDLGFVRLETNPKATGPSVRESRGFNISYCTRYPYSAMAYAIAPRTASKLVDAGSTISAPLDKFIKDFWVHKQPLFQLSPAVVAESPIGSASTIGQRRRSPGVRVAERLCRLAYKGASAIRRAAYNLRFRYQLATLPGNASTLSKPLPGTPGTD